MKSLTLLASFLFLNAGLRAANIPSDAELTTLVKGTLSSFKTAVQTEDFTAFHKSVATFWQKQTTPQQFADHFSQFTDPRGKSAFVKMFEKALTLQPSFEPKPEIGENTELIVHATYPLDSPLPVTLDYRQEGGAWKLVGLDINAHADAEAIGPAPEVPSDTEIKTLNDKVLRAFNTALRKKDFTDFLPFWMNRMTVEKLQVAFQGAIDAEQDFSNVLKKVSPVLRPKPFVNDKGLLEVVAVYPAGSKNITFTLEYGQEEEAWKLYKLAFDFTKADSAEGEK